MKAYILIGIAIITVIYVIIKKIWYRSPEYSKRIVEAMEKEEQLIPVNVKEVRYYGKENTRRSVMILPIRI